MKLPYNFYLVIYNLDGYEREQTGYNWMIKKTESTVLEIYNVSDLPYVLIFLSSSSKRFVDSNFRSWNLKIL